MSDNKLASDVNLIKAVEQLEEELRPFIEAQREARGLSDINDKVESAIPSLAADPQPASLSDLPQQLAKPLNPEKSSSEPSDKT